MFCEDFLPFCRFSFCRLFIVQMPFSLMSSHLFIFAFITQAFGVISKKSLPRSMSRSSSPIFSFRNFMASGLLFNFLIYGVRIQFHFLCVDIQFSLHHLLKRLFFHHCVFFPPLSKIR